MKTATTFFAALSLSLAANAAQADDFNLTSPDIKEGIPLADIHVFKGFGCEGGNVSPALSWTNPPAGTKSFVITAYDPDAPTGSGWWHWLAFNIPADTRAVDQGASGQMPEGTVESVTDFGKTGFGGACPPKGEMHRYQFTIHALGVEKLDLGSDTNAAVVGYMTNANSLGKATITVPYTR
ncbi:YbhB/YbcL family Raf kinase inhibitor-like protein [Aestuariispira insulae]|uniref:PBP family phospholipid-binding protein n=1 Tax=Aestuariispira insulae TaxID=1461337 RepID=A0A3D9HM18_9PROT|nr:YbhB/YbcL family Raf kinase inhibitor-like protein [Aestuariispira insulae]RED49946.1 hypothetical protein DFP90_105319 [Aestuariispira insulae]